MWFSRHIHNFIETTLYFAEVKKLSVLNLQSGEPVEQLEQLLHTSPAPDLRPGLGLLAQLDQDPGDAPQKLDSVAQQQAEQQRQPLQLPQLIPDLLYRRQEAQQLHAHPGREVARFSLTCYAQRSLSVTLFWLNSTS